MRAPHFSDLPSDSYGAPDRTSSKKVLDGKRQLIRRLITRPKRLSSLLRLRRLISPGVVNRTFENRTQSNSIELNPWIEFDWVRQSNEIEHHTFSEFDFRTNRIQSNKSNSIELNPSDWVRLSSETELNRTQLNGFRSIGSGESIQREP